MSQRVVYSAISLVCIAFTTVCYFFIREKEILFHKAERIYQEKSFQKSIPLYESAFKQGVRSPLLYYHLGDAYTSENRFDEAAELYKQYLKAHPKNREMRIRLARVLSWQGKLSESTLQYKIANEGIQE